MAVTAWLSRLADTSFFERRGFVLRQTGFIRLEANFLNQWSVNSNLVRPGDHARYPGNGCAELWNSLIR
jgi:hypothetical protein